MEHPTVRGLSGWIPLARGGTTLVWEAHQDLLSRAVAVKVDPQGLAEGVYETFAERPTPPAACPTIQVWSPSTMPVCFRMRDRT